MAEKLYKSVSLHRDDHKELEEMAAVKSKQWTEQTGKPMTCSIADVINMGKKLLQQQMKKEAKS